MGRSSKDDTDTARTRGSLAGRLGSIPHSPRSEKPRVDKPHTSAPPKADPSKPRPGKPRKPLRPDVGQQRASTVRSAPPPPPPTLSVAGRLGSFVRGPKRGR